MYTRTDLVVGQYYWVLPEPDEDSQEPWEDDVQPARFNGRNADGEALWNFIGIEGSTNWPVIWIGERIGAQTVSHQNPPHALNWIPPWTPRT